jgi:ATP-dependent helicase/nuclease subunit B
MSGQEPRLFTLPPGVPFLPALCDALLGGALVPGFCAADDPMALADTTIYLPTRRAARELRAILAGRAGGRPAILPIIRPLGAFEEDLALLDPLVADIADLPPPIDAMERLLTLAPLVQRWKSRLPAHVAALFEESIVVPASTADALWLARDLADLMDEMETEEADWSRLAGLVPDELARWWQVTLDFLRIVTEHWPAFLAAAGRSNPAAHRVAVINAEARRLAARPPAGPVIAAGSTGSIPATARLLATIAWLPKGAVILPGLDRELDAEAWAAVGSADAPASAFGHPQAGLKRLLAALGVAREKVTLLGAPSRALALRARLVSEALRPAETTAAWAQAGGLVAQAREAGALAGVTVLEAANPREEALAVAVALRLAVETAGRTAALVTPDRELARRVSAELRRFGIHADDSAGQPLSATPPGTLLQVLLEAVFRPGDPVRLLALVKHPRLRLGRTGSESAEIAAFVERVALRGRVGRPDVLTLAADFAAAWTDTSVRRPWADSPEAARYRDAKAFLEALVAAVAPLAAWRGRQADGVGRIAEATVVSLEALCRDRTGALGALYGGDAGESMAAFLRRLVASTAPVSFDAAEWPEMVKALLAGEVVRPSVGTDPRVSIWGTLEARLQSVDMLVLGGLNEGEWPRSMAGDRFLSRLMKAEMALEPPERRIGQAAHDFEMAMGTGEVVLSRSARTADAPAVASRWLQRFLAVVGEEQAAAMRARGARLVEWARALDDGHPVPPATQPQPSPPLASRPKRFSVTEIETLRRDPYAVYARRILRLEPLERLLREPDAADRGNLFHEILHRFSESGCDPGEPDAISRLVSVGCAMFDAAALPSDVRAIWWPRFLAMAEAFIRWEREGRGDIVRRFAEAQAEPVTVAATGVTLSGRADRLDLRADGRVDILDYKTGSSPSKAQAFTLLAPQLALEGALLRRGAFSQLGRREPAGLAYVRLKPDGSVVEESVLEHKKEKRDPVAYSEEAWSRLERLLEFYARPEGVYRSRALPFREGETDGDYDHLARVLEWSAGASAGEDGGGSG